MLQEREGLEVLTNEHLHVLKEQIFHLFTVVKEKLEQLSGSVLQTDCSFLHSKVQPVFAAVTQHVCSPRLK